jgi:hypothetical protein
MLTRRSVPAILASGALLIGLAGLTGFGIASALVPTHDATPISPLAYVPDANGAHVSVVAPDLAANALPWAVRVYRSQTGLACFEAGRLDGQIRNGDYGQVDADDGRFHPSKPADADFGQVDPETGNFNRLPLEAGTSCTDLTQAPSSIAVNHYPAQGRRGARAVVFGVTAPDVNNVHLLIDGDHHELIVSADSYIAVVSEEVATRAELIFTMTDGTLKRVRLPAVSSPPLQPPGPES